MISINTTQIDGDVSVGRNAAIGGNINVAGTATVKHNLKVDGWLEARNIKGVAKGLFLTEEKLKKAYPMPHPGWWALVGDNLPATIYIEDGGKWYNTNKQGGEFSLEVDELETSVEQLTGDVNLLKQAVGSNQKALCELKASVKIIDNDVNAIQEMNAEQEVRLDNIERQLLVDNETRAASLMDVTASTDTGIKRIQLVNTKGQRMGDSVSIPIMMGEGGAIVDAISKVEIDRICIP